MHNKKIPYILLCIMLTGLLWLKLDKDLSYFGKSFFHYRHILPYNVQPIFQYSFEGGFSIVDSGGMPVIGPVMEFVNKDGIRKEVSKVIRYGIDKNDIVVEIKTTDEQSEYITLIKDTSYKLCPDCLFMKSIDSDQFNLAQFKWYTVPADTLSWQELTRNILALLLFFSISFLIYIIFKVTNIKILTGFENDTP